MAAVTQPAEQVTELLQNLKVDSQTKVDDTVEVAANVDGDALDGSVDASVSLGMSDISSPVIVYEGGIDTGMYCIPDGYAVPHGFYYGGYEWPVGDWDDYSHFVGIDGMDLGVYGDNGSVIYQAAGYYYAQPIYNSYSPGTPIPANSQMYGSPAYTYPGYFYQPAPQGVHFMPPATAVNGEAPPNIGESFIPGGDSSNAVVVGNDMSVASIQAYPVTLLASPGPYGHSIIPINGSSTISQDGLVSYEYPLPDTTMVAEVRHATPQPLPVPGLPEARAPVLTHVPTGQHPQVPPSAPVMPGALLRPYQPLPRMYSGFAGPGRGQGDGFESCGNGQSWVAVDKGKPLWQGYGPVCNGHTSLDVLVEQNRGPRTIRMGNQEMSEGDSQLIRGSNGNFDTLGASTDNKEQYNRFDFPVNYDSAKFFIIKSYSEDDIHKSIKYNVWASTPNGNKKLDAAYQEAQGRTENCPLFLFFSVNASGQFCGVAEMVGHVDFNKSMDFWQQDKWNGRFPVKWHVIKDVPNNQFRHIILDNNDNKPVTNSRDTQEVRFELGIEMLRIFKNYVFKTSILDDFEFYENRQKAMQEKKARQRSNQQPQQFSAYRGGNEFDYTHTQEGILLKSHYGRPKIEHTGDCSNKVKDFQPSRLLPQATARHEAFPEKEKSLSKVGGKRELVCAGRVEAETMKTCSESKDANTGHGDCIKDSTAKM